MKKIPLYLACLLIVTAAYAKKDSFRDTAKHASAVARQVRQVKAPVKQGMVQFSFGKQTVENDEHKDSALIIFDRYNHTGAGVVYQVFPTDKDHCITIPALPAGRYYVTIQCLGLHRDKVEKLIWIRAKKSEKIRIKLEDSEEFSKDKVVIPADHVNFEDLAILKMK